MRVLRAVAGARVVFLCAYVCAAVSVGAVLAAEAAASTFIPVSQRADMVVDSSSETLYIASDSSILRWDLATGSFLESVPIGGSLIGLELTSDEETLVVVSNWGAQSPGRLVQMNTSTLTTSSVLTGLAPLSMALGADDSVFIGGTGYGTYVVRHPSADAPWSMYDYYVEFPLLGSSGSRGLVVNAQRGNRAALRSYTVTEGVKIAYGAAISPSVFDLALDRNGTRFWLASSNDGLVEYAGKLFETGRRIGSASSEPRGVAYDPHQPLLYVPWASTGTLRVIDTRTLAVAREYSVGATLTAEWPGIYPVGHVRVTSEGDRAFVLVSGGINVIPLKRELSGVVRSGHSGRPVPRALIEGWQDRGDGWALVATSSADAAGLWYLGVDDAADTRIKLMDPSGAHEPAWLGGVDATSAASCLPGSVDALALDATLTVESTSTLSGRVVDPEFGDVVAGITVSLYGSDGAVTGTATSGPDGVFSLTDLLADESHRLGFTDASGTWKDSFYGGSSTLTSAVEITLTAGSVRSLGDVSLMPNPYFSGVVRDAVTGAPMEGVEVKAYSWDELLVWPGAFPVGSAVTDAKGRYRMAGPLAGKYYVLAFVDTTGLYRDITWPQSGLHTGDSWGWLPRPERGSVRSADAYMLPLKTLKAQRVERVAGSDRYGTALAMSRRNFPSAGTVVLAGGANYPDALAAAPLAGVYEGPLLLTPRATLSTALVAELRRLKTTNVIIVGGDLSVSGSVEQSLKNKGFRVRRISGADRYAVASKIALEVSSKSDNDEPFVVRGDAYIDALSVSSFAYMQKRPVLLCPTTGMTPSVRTAWERLHVSAGDTAIFVGGPKSITDAMYKDFRRVSGSRLDQNNVWIWDPKRPTTYGTAAAVVDFFDRYYYALRGGFDYVGIASGDVFPDALAAGPAAGYRGGPLVLTTGAKLASDASRVLNHQGPYVMKLQAFGGPSTLSNSCLASARSALGSRVYDMDSPTRSIPLPAGGLLSNSSLAPTGPGFPAGRLERGVTDGELPDDAPQRRFQDDR